MWKRIVFAIVFMCTTTAIHATGPVLWKVSDEDTNIHILGSVHVLKPGTVWMNDGLQRVISDADTIYLEISSKEQAPQNMQPLIAKYGLLVEGDSLKNHLPDDVYNELSAELIALGMQEQQFSRFKPWMAGTVYSVFKFIKYGFKPTAGVEATVVSLAQAKGLPVEGIETAESQMKMFDDLTNVQELAFLQQMLQEKDKLQEIMEMITEAWTMGNIDALTKIFDGSFAEYPELEKKILTNRNKEWIPKIKSILDQSGDYMIVVGTGHLVGEDSVIELMHEKGMKVQRIQ